MLNKVDFPLTTSQISEFVLDKGYTTYFKLQEAISELTQSELIRSGHIERLFNNAAVQFDPVSGIVKSMPRD